MKVLLKKEVYKSYKQYMGPTKKANGHRNAGFKKKKKTANANN